MHLRFLRPRKKIFGIGLPKTGTKTLHQCLLMLGYKHFTYDMDLTVQLKRGNLKAITKVARKYESFEDWPWFLCYKEMDHEFPGSKFILTLRKDKHVHETSLRKHHHLEGIHEENFEEPSWWREVFGFPAKEWDYEKSAEWYEKHQAEVLEYFIDRPKDLLIVCWETGDGWEKLCKFLEKPVPAQPFPHSNNSDERLRKALSHSMPEGSQD